MEKKKVSIPIAFAAVWILLLMLMNSLKVPHHFRVGIYLNLLFILAVIIIGLYVQIKKDQKFHPFVINFKNSLKNAGKYMLIITAFLFCYLKSINPQFLNGIKEARMASERTLDWEVVKTNPMHAEKTWEEYLEQADESAAIISSVSINLSIYFLGMFLMSVMYSILVPLFYKKIILRL